MMGGVTRHMLPYLSGVPHPHVNRGPFLESPGNFTGPESKIQIEI